jgi:hypothetical protein
MTAPATIAACIARCADSRDGRGRWRAERDCAAELARDGDARIAAMCAAAARRVGEALHLAHRMASERVGQEQQQQHGASLAAQAGHSPCVSARSAEAASSEVWIRL